MLFIKLYPVVEKDIVWFGEVIDGLNGLTRPLEIKLALKADNLKCSTLAKEYERMTRNCSDGWRFSEVNFDYTLCPTYSRTMLVPEGISDTVLMHASRFRVQGRIPLLCNIYRGRALMRSGQPLVGLTQKRCVQDEKLIEAIKHCSSSINGEEIDSSTTCLVIVDARPSSSAFANTLIGAGIERLECYEGSERIYLNMESIHPVRESHDRLSDQIKLISSSSGSSSSDNASNRSLWIEIEEGCGWLDHLRGILEGVGRIVELMTQKHRSHVLIHCSDGWDRTSQLVSLVQLCLFPRYRTRQGFRMLIQKDWLSSGHRFSDRNGHCIKAADKAPILESSTHNPWNTIKRIFQDVSNNGYAGSTVMSNSSAVYSVDTANSTSTVNSHEECPIFLQFIEATVQLVRQFPLHFTELTDDFLLELVDASYEECGEYFGNCEKERSGEIIAEGDLIEEKEVIEYDEAIEYDKVIEDCLIPKVERSKMILWPAYYKRYF
jgi:myotubularin-related protein 6/7/8